MGLICLSRFSLDIDFSKKFSSHYVQTYTEPCQTSKTEPFAKKVNGYKPFHIVYISCLLKVLHTPLVHGLSPNRSMRCHEF